MDLLCMGPSRDMVSGAHKTRQLGPAGAILEVTFKNFIPLDFRNFSTGLILSQRRELGRSSSPLSALHSA